MELKVNIPKEIIELIKKSESIDWARIARLAILEKAKQLEFLGNFKSDSDLTENGAISLGKKVNEKVAQKYKEM